MDTLRQAFDTMKDNVAERFKGNWCSMIVGYTPTQILPVLMPWESDEAKHLMIAMAREQFKSIGVVQYAASFEAWMAVEPWPEDGKPDIRKPRPGFVMPSKRSDRQEIVFVVAENIDGESIGGYWHIGRRGKRARVTTFEDMTGPDKGFQTTLLTNMFGRSFLH